MPMTHGTYGKENSRERCNKYRYDRKGLFGFVDCHWVN